MPRSKPTKVYPIAGRFGVGVPLIEHEVPSRKEADELVATGLFALSEKEANDQAYTTPETTEATDENVKVRAAETPKAEAPAPAPAAPDEAPAAPAAGEEPVQPGPDEAPDEPAEE